MALKSMGGHEDKSKKAKQEKAKEMRKQRSLNREQFAAERRAAGAAVTLKPFAGSPHVAHYRAYPEDYAAAIRTWSETELGT